VEALAPAKDLAGKAPVPSAVHGAGRVPGCRATADGPAVEVPAKGRGEVDLAAEGEDAAVVGGDHERCPHGKPTNIR